MKSIFTLRDLGKQYGAGASSIQELKDVNLEINKGEPFVVLGPSGLGKSSRLNILDGLDRASAGDAIFRGTSLCTMTQGELTNYRRRYVASCFVSTAIERV